MQQTGCGACNAPAPALTPGRCLPPTPPLQLRFTCNLCGETNEKALNPHAWREGSVFMRCEVRCSALCAGLAADASRPAACMHKRWPAPPPSPLCYLLSAVSQLLLALTV